MVVVLGCGDNQAGKASGDAGGDASSDTEAPTWPSVAMHVVPTGIDTAQLRWSSAVDNVGVAAYHVYLDQTLVTDVAGTETTYDASGFVVGQNYSYRVEASDAAGNTSQDGPMFIYVAPPADPASSATPIDPTIATDFVSSTTFIYSGPGAIQQGVATGAIDTVRVVLLRGKVVERDGDPLAGVTVTVPAHPEYGTTLTRADGVFDFATNGGGLVTVRYTRPGYLPVDRQIRTRWNEYDTVPTVTLTALDPKVTAVDLATLTQPVVAESTVVSDANPARHVAMLFSPGMTATMQLPDGTTQPVSMMHVRATEFTVGDSGPSAMPGELPNGTAYTHASELSIDEALAAGATSVEFSQAVPFYIENYIGAPVGGLMPLGYYDRTRLAWVAMPDGRVIKLLGVTNMLADLDVDGSGAPADATALAQLGVSDDERRTLATTYATGTELWRMSTTHFSVYDCNTSLVFSDPPLGPDTLPPRPPKRPGDDCQKAGSIVDCRKQGLREAISIAGTPYSLYYSSDWVASSASGFDIPITSTTPPAGLKYIKLHVEIAGVSTDMTFQPAASIVYPFVWNGQDAYGRQTYGVAEAQVTVTYMYRPFRIVRGYTGGAVGTNSFARDLGGYIRSAGGLQEPDDHSPPWYPVSVSTTVPLYRAPQRTAAGWDFGVHHVWEPREKRLYAGTGEDWTSALIGPVIEQPSGSTQVGFPISLGMAADGTTYSAGPVTIGGSYAVSLDRNGVGKIFAGQYGTTGFCGDGGPANKACLHTVIGTTVAPSGEIFLVDSGNNRIRKIALDGTISTFAGNGMSGFSGDGGPATSAQLGLSYVAQTPLQLAVARDGTVYIPDRANNRVRRVLPDGIIDTLAGTGTPGSTGDGGDARAATLYAPVAVAVAEDGAVYVAEMYGYRVRRIGPDGIISTVAGGGSTVQEMGLGTDTQLSNVVSLSVDRENNLYIGEPLRIRMLTKQGVLSTFAGSAFQTSSSGAFRVGAPVRGGDMSPYNVAVGPDNSLHVALASFGVGRIALGQTKLKLNELVVPDPDGNEAYVFDSGGRHLRTVDPRTGASRLVFGYDKNGQVVSITDAFGQVTTIQRNAQGAPTSIVAPDGTTTMLTVGADGNLASAADPLGGTTAMTYDAAGRLATITRPARGTSTFAYGAFGLLASDTSTSGHTLALAHNVPVNANDPTVVTITSGAGRIEKYSTTDAEDHSHVYSTMLPAGNVLARTVIGATTTIASDSGMTLVMQTRPTPRWGSIAPFASSVATTTPLSPAVTATSSYSESLSDPTDVFSVTAVDRSVSLPGAGTHTLHAAPSSGTWVQSTSDANGIIRQLTTTATGALLGYVVDNRFSGSVFTLDANGHESSEQIGSSLWSYTNDVAGHATEVIDPIARTTQYMWNANGEVTRKTLPSGRAFALGRNGAGDVTTYTMPSGAVHTFTYNDAGLVTSYATPGSATCVFDYDADGRPISSSYASDRKMVYTRDASFRVTTADDGRAATMTTYVGSTARVARLDWAAAASGATQALSMQYDGPFVTQRQFSGAATGTYTYQLDSLRRVTGVTLDATAQRAITRDGEGQITSYGPFTYERLGPAGAPSKVSDGTGILTLGFDALARQTRHTLVVAGITVYDEQLTYDAAGQVTNRAETIGGVSHAFVYAYDADGQLLAVTRDTALAESYTFDVNGNRTSRTDASSVVESSTYDARDAQLTRDALTYNFDTAGYLTQLGTTTTNYATHGELLDANVGGTAVSYAYDGNGRRTARTTSAGTTQYLYGDPDNELAVTDVRDPAGVLTTLYYDGSFRLFAIVRGGATYYVATDVAGTPRIVVNAAGTIVKQIDRDTYGRLIADSAPTFDLPIGFAGGVDDALTGLVRLGARDYDPFTGRFTIRDPLLQNNEEINLYAYAQNAPSNARDARGLWSASFSLCSGACADFKVARDPETGKWGYCSGIGPGTPSVSFGFNPIGKVDPTGYYMKVSASVKIGGFGFDGEIKATHTPECGDTLSARDKIKVPVPISPSGDTNGEVGVSPKDIRFDNKTDVGAKAIWGACASF